jgi:hypothetical protein
VKSRAKVNKELLRKFEEFFTIDITHGKMVNETTRTTIASMTSSNIYIYEG